MPEVRNVQPDDHRCPCFTADPGPGGLLDAPDLLKLECPGISGWAGTVESVVSYGDAVTFENVKLSYSAHMQMINGRTFMQLFGKFRVVRGDRVVASSEKLQVVGGDLPPIHKVPLIYRTVTCRKKLT